MAIPLQNCRFREMASGDFVVVFAAQKANARGIVASGLAELGVNVLVLTDGGAANHTAELGTDSDLPPDWRGNATRKAMLVHVHAGNRRDNVGRLSSAR
jgi:hypothetical protein